MSGESILIAIFVGLFAGWLVNLIGQDPALGLTGTVTIAIFGAILSEGLLPLTGLNLGLGAAGDAINAGLGAALLLFLIRIARAEEEPRVVRPGKP